MWSSSYSSWILMKLEFFSIYFRKSHKYQTIKISLVDVEFFHAESQKNGRA